MLYHPRSCHVICYEFLNGYTSHIAKRFLVQVLNRGEKIELLVDKTDNLHSQVAMHVL